MTNRIITARISIPPNTLPSNPYSVTLVLPASIINDISFNYFSIGNVVNPTETGLRFFANGGVFIPDMGSIDYLTNEVYVVGGGYATFSSGWLSGEINRKISGPPYELTIKGYNLDAAQSALYYINVRVANDILLPPAPITNDIKKND